MTPGRSIPEVSAWRRNRVMRGVVGILVGSTAGQGLVIVSMPLMTRLYDPADFGLLAVFTSVVTMLAVVAAGRMDAAVPLPSSTDDAAAAAWAGIALAAGFASLVAFAGWLTGPRVAGLLGVPQLADLWWLVAVTVLALAIYEVLTAWMVRTRAYRAIAHRNVTQGVGQIGTQLGLGMAGVRPLGLLVGVCVGKLLGVGGLASHGGLLRQAPPDAAALRTIILRYRRFPLVSSWSTLLNKAGLEAPILVISAVYGDIRAGLIGLAIRVVGGPAGVIGQAVGQVFAGEASARIRDRASPVQPLVQKITVRLLALGALPVAVILVLGPGLFALVFGAQWADAGHYAQWLALGYFAQFAVSPISQTLLLLEHQGQQLAWDTTRVLLTAGAPAACAIVGGSITVAVIALSLGYVASYALLYLLCVRAAGAFDSEKRE